MTLRIKNKVRLKSKKPKDFSLSFLLEILLIYLIFDKLINKQLMIFTREVIINVQIGFGSNGRNE